MQREIIRSRVRSHQPLHLLAPLLMSIAAAGSAWPFGAADSSTYVGDANEERVAAVTTDAAGNTYVTGIRYLDRTPGTGTPNSDVFVIKQDAAGNFAFQATFGQPGDIPNSIAADPNGNIYVAVASRINGTLVGLLVKLSANGTPVYSRQIAGAQGSSSLNAVATDAQGSVYVGGFTAAPDYPHTPGLPSASGTVAFFAKLSGAGDLIYAGAIGGSAVASCNKAACPPSTGALAIAVDAKGNAYVAGNTNTTDLPATSGVVQPHGVGAFVAKINSAGTGLSYLTYLDNYFQTFPFLFGPGTSATTIAVDATGNAYITGNTTNPAFPVTSNAYQTNIGSQTSSIPLQDIFVAKLRPDASAFIWASYLGAVGTDTASSLGIDAAGNVWVSGTGNSPTVDSASAAPSTATQFLVEFDSTGSTISYSNLHPPGVVMALDRSGTLHIAGGAPVLTTLAANTPMTPLIAGISTGANSSFPPEGMIVPAEIISIYGSALGPLTPAIAAPDSTGSYPTTLAGVRVLVGGIPAPLLYVSDIQINAVTPVEIGADTEGVQIVRDGNAAPTFRTVVLPGFPSIFYGSNAIGVLNADGTWNSIANPASLGSIVSIWTTGMHPKTGVDGHVATSASNNADCSVQINGVASAVAAPVLYCGDAPGLIFGVTQLNVLLPVNAPALQGSIDLHLSSGGVNGNGVSVYVRQ
jgi:uncharacterized protein (TIGR03437 family)